MCEVTAPDANEDGSRTALELSLCFSHKARVTRLEVVTNARVVEWLVDGEYVASSKTSASTASHLSRAICKATLRPGMQVTARLKAIPNGGARCALGEVLYDCTRHEGSNPMHSFDMALVRERLSAAELSPEASSLMSRIDVHRQAAAATATANPAGMGGMLSALAGMAGDNSGSPLGGLAPMLAGFLGGGGGMGSGLSALASAGPSVAADSNVTPTDAGSKHASSMEPALASQIDPPTQSTAQNLIDLEQRLQSRMDRIEGKLDRLLTLLEDNSAKASPPNTARE
jgi:hypothetical protein